MTSDEAKQALKEGKRVRRDNWHEKTFIKIIQYVVDSDGQKEELEKYFQRVNKEYTGWEIVE